MSTTWNADPETFSFASVHFDVAVAKEILANNPRRVGQMPIGEVAGLVGTPDTIVLGISVSWERVQHDSTIDLSVPVILAHTPVGSLIPIDGWHRIARAKMLGIEHLPAVMLNKTESKKTWISHA